MHLKETATPAILIDFSKLVNNIKFMSEKAEDFGVNLRPHIKTHKCVEIARLQREHGTKGITTATLGEAAYFIQAGFDDVTLAVPISTDMIEHAIQLSQKASLKILVDHPHAVEQLASKTRGKDVILDVLLKVDCGYHRCGVDSESGTAVRIVRKVIESPNLAFEGILTHAGHSYSTANIDELVKIAKREQSVMVRFARTLSKENTEMKPRTVSIGSTPTMMVTDEMQDGITEIRPGNYVFFDYTQVMLGSCNVEDCALTVLSSVISSYQDRVIINAGSTALSYDPGPRHIDPNCGYGRIFDRYEASILASDTLIVSLSQEHGKVETGQRSPLSSARIGHRIRIIPNHSCLTANLFECYSVMRESEVVARWPKYGGRSMDSTR